MNKKLSTELSMALDTPENLRDKGYDLNVGFNGDINSWTLIIKYTGEIEEIGREYNATVTELLGGFGIIEINADIILDLATDNRIIYIEKPRSFVQGRTSISGFSTSCMNVPYYVRNLRGNGITVAVLDSGVDIFHSDFYDEIDGVRNSRIGLIWDQTLFGNPPAGYNLGVLFDNEDINNGLNSYDFPSRDISGHGTAVAGIISACTPMVNLLIVKLYSNNNNDVNTINLILAIDFAVRYSIDNNAPLVINLSYGNNNGDHNGNSILEEYIDTIAVLSKNTIVVGSGNDGTAGRHAEIILGNESWYKRDFQIYEGESGISIQIWRDYQDVIDIFLVTPNGNEIGPFNNYNDLMIYEVDDMNIRVLNGEPTPINSKQETYISIIPLNDYIESGIWSIRIIPKKIVNGRLDMWLPVEGSTVSNISFLTPSDYTTLTIPSTSKNVITVGAYDPNSLNYAGFSGRGYTVDNMIKPDIVAPGVNIDAPMVGGGYNNVSGTSFATPFVSAGAAMLMEYGIVNGVDPFLYGEKVKAYLISGVKELPGTADTPNPMTGWGALCVENSIPWLYIIRIFNAILFY